MMFLCWLCAERGPSCDTTPIADLRGFDLYFEFGCLRRVRKVAISQFFAMGFETGFRIKLLARSLSERGLA
jgi:hypothetical protein